MTGSLQTTVAVACINDTNATDDTLMILGGGNDRDNLIICYPHANAAESSYSISKATPSLLARLDAIQHIIRFSGIGSSVLIQYSLNAFAGSSIITVDG